MLIILDNTAGKDLIAIRDPTDETRQLTIDYYALLLLCAMPEGTLFRKGRNRSGTVDIHMLDVVEQPTPAG